MALTSDQIQELLADNRGRGDYGQYLNEFVKSGSGGEEVNMATGILAGKDANKVKIGLENAKKSRDKDGALKFPEAQDVLIIKKGDVVFVVNRAAVSGEAE